MEEAKAAGLRAVVFSRQTLDAIEKAIEAGRWNEAGMRYQVLEAQSNRAVDTCKKLVRIQAERS